MEATATEAHIISYGLQRALDGEQLGIRTFQRWVELGVLERIWAMLIEECEELRSGLGMAVCRLRYEQGAF